MAVFGKMELTEKGSLLLNKVITRKRQLEISRVAVGSGEFTGDIWKLTSLVSNVLDGTIVKSGEAEGQWEVEAVFTNEGVTEDFAFREIGVFALDPDDGEVLYAYANSGENCDYISVYNGSNLEEEKLNIKIYTAGTSNVYAEIIKSEMASQIGYDDSTTNINSDNVQTAIEKIVGKVNDIDIESKDKDGGNADTVDGYHASEFTKYREFNSLDELAETQYEGLFYIGGSEEITGISLKSGRDMDIQPDNTDFLEIYTRIYRDKDGKMYAADVYNTEYDFWTKRDLKTFSFDGHLHSVSDIEDFPKSLPASGGNADTVGGKQASDFALKNHSHTDFSAWDSDSDSDTSWGVSISASGINFQWNDDINDSELHISENGLMGGGSFLPAISNFGNISAQSFLGNGSNLTNVNADTVDGKHASDFQLIKSGYQNCTDWNSLTTSGMYGLVKANQKNAPDRFNMFFPMVFAYSDSGITQLAIPYAISNNSGDYDLHKIFIRHCFNGDWDNWSMIGNGCNADTAQFINTYSKTNGYNSNNYGNFVHNGTSANDSWCITSNNVNPTFKVYYESGNVSANGTITANLFNGNGSNLTNLNASYVNKKTVSFNASAGNWYRLAKGKPHNNSDNTGACGIMTIMADVHNYHSSDVISLTQNGGDGNFTILNHSRFNQFFTKFRMSKGADNYMYIDGYTNTAANSVTVTFTFSGIGWTLCESIVSVNAGFGVLVMEKEPEIN